MSPGVDASSATNQAELLRQEGNVLFRDERFGPAIDAYTGAITLCPYVPIYWTNRALCHRKRKDWKRVEDDCQRAIELDHNSVKAHYMLGLALLKKKDYATGVKELERALDLGRGGDPNGYMVDEIWKKLSKAKFKQWEDESAKRSSELLNLKEACETALKEKYFRDLSNMEGFVKQLEGMRRVFNKASEDDVPVEVPDYLCCKIALDIFRDPVITPSGVSYERSVILQHLEQVGRFDPVTREPLDPSQLIPNLAIKEAVRSFLETHGWAYRL